MAQVTLQIKNIDKIRALFQKMPGEVTKALDSVVYKSALLIQAEAMKEAPVNKGQGGGKKGFGGNLRQSISASKLSIGSAMVQVGANYGVYVHEGTRPHQIRIVNAKVLANQRAGMIFGKVVNHPGTKANPFLQRAVDNKSGAVNSEFEKAIHAIIKL